MTISKKTSCLQAALPAVAFALALTVAAGGAAAKVDWRSVEPGDERSAALGGDARGGRKI